MADIHSFTADSPRLLWMIPKESGILARHTQGLWPSVREQARLQGWSPLEPLFFSPTELKTISSQLRSLAPHLIHLQHDYAPYGGPRLLRYSFPGWLKELRSILPQSKVIATAHTVLPRATSFLRRRWMSTHWSGLDGLISVSKADLRKLQGTIHPNARVIPPFVPERPFGLRARRVSRNQNEILAAATPGQPLLLFIGAGHTDDGAELALEAARQLSVPFKLLILREQGKTREVPGYLASLRHKIQTLGLGDKVQIPTGALPRDLLEEYLHRATVLLIPRSGPDSTFEVLWALSHGTAVLTSDSESNLEIHARQSTALELFRSGDSADLVRKLQELLSSPEKIETLRVGAAHFAQSYSPGRIAEEHLKFYNEILAFDH